LVQPERVALIGEGRGRAALFVRLDPAGWRISLVQPLFTARRRRAAISMSDVFYLIQR
jgi:hypothetical protein